MTDSGQGLPPILEKAFDTSLVYAENGATITLDSNVSRDEALLLSYAVKYLRPVKSIEIGLAKGVSTLAILGAIRENKIGHHVVCDPFQADYQNAGIEMVRRAGLDQFWTFHRKFAEEVVPTIDSCEFAFIDASHLFDLTLCEFVLVDKKLCEGGVVGFHDLWMPSLQKLLRFVLANRGYEIWSPPTTQVLNPGRSSSLKVRMASWVGRSPLGKKFLAPEIKKPWQNFNLPNLVLLRKIRNDDRHWTSF